MIFCIKKWERSDNLVTWNPDEELFFITVHNLSPVQGTSDNLRRYLACMGNIVSFSYLVLKSNESYSIIVRASIRYKERLRFRVIAENELGFTNTVKFESHHFPNNFVGFATSLAISFKTMLTLPLLNNKQRLNKLMQILS